MKSRQKSKAVCLVALLTPTWSNVVVALVAAPQTDCSRATARAVVRSGRLMIALAPGNDEVW